MRVVRLIWFSIIFSTLLYGVLAYAAERRYTLQPLAVTLLTPVVIVLYAVAVALFAAAFFVGARVGRSSAAAYAPVVQFVLLEAVAITGLLAVFVMHDWRLYLPAWALALMGLFRATPTTA